MVILTRATRLDSHKCRLKLTISDRSFILSIVVNIVTSAGPVAWSAGGLAVVPIEGVDRVLTPDASVFITGLVRRFAPGLRALLAARRERQARFDGGELPDFLPET